MEVQFWEGIPAKTLIINYMPENVTHMELFDIFSTIGTVESINIIRHPNGKCKGYGFVRYKSMESAMRAATELRQIPLRQKLLQASFAKPHSHAFKDTTIIIRNVPWYFKEYELFTIFSNFGHVATIKLIPRGLIIDAFVRFVYKCDADNALNQRIITVKSVFGLRKLHVELAVPPIQNTPAHRLFVYNIPVNATRNTIAELFQPYGTVQQVDYIFSSSGQYSGYVCVNMICSTNIFNVVDALTGTKVGGNTIKVTLQKLATV